MPASRALSKLELARPVARCRRVPFGTISPQGLLVIVSWLGHSAWHRQTLNECLQRKCQVQRRVVGHGEGTVACAAPKGAVQTPGPPAWPRPGRGAPQFSGSPGCRDPTIRLREGTRAVASAPFLWGLRKDRAQGAEGALSCPQASRSPGGGWGCG